MNQLDCAVRCSQYDLIDFNLLYDEREQAIYNDFSVGTYGVCFQLECLSNDAPGIDMQVQKIIGKHLSVTEIKVLDIGDDSKALDIHFLSLVGQIERWP